MWTVTRASGNCCPIASGIAATPDPAKRRKGPTGASSSTAKKRMQLKCSTCQAAQAQVARYRAAEAFPCYSIRGKQSLACGFRNRLLKEKVLGYTIHPKNRYKLWPKCPKLLLSRRVFPPLMQAWYWAWPFLVFAADAVTPGRSGARKQKSWQAILVELLWRSSYLLIYRFCLRFEDHPLWRLAADDLAQ